MARKQRNDVDYFPHPVSHGKKMSYLEKKYGNDGYATWFKILEELGNTDYHYLDLSDEVQVMFLSDRCLITEECLLKIINDLIRLQEFDRELWEKHNILFNEKFVESISDAYKKRSNQCIDKNSLLILLGLKQNPNKGKGSPNSGKDTPKGGENPQSKLKDSKEEDSKEEPPNPQGGNPSVFNFKKHLLGLGADTILVTEWMKIRKKKDAINSEKALTDFLREVEKAHLTINQALDFVTHGSRQWRGFRADWYENEKKNETTDLVSNR